jgi:hypothetical protein
MEMEWKKKELMKTDWLTVFWDVAPCSLVETDSPDDGGSKRLWNIGQFQPD